LSELLYQRMDSEEFCGKESCPRPKKSIVVRRTLRIRYAVLGLGSSFTLPSLMRFCEAGDVNKAEKKPLMDRVDSALKEITTTMKQLDRSVEAIEAINSFCHLRSYEPQESLTNIMLQFLTRYNTRLHEYTIVE
ncbi:hypothetical protein Tco_0685046, partial [Tanacetum coccineum]